MKYQKWLVSFFATAFFICGVYLMQIATTKVVNLEKSFTFLVIETEGIEACISQVQLDGGAGFLLKTDDGEKVALSVYLQEENGILVKEQLSQKYNFLKIEKKSPSALYFKGIKQKRTASAVQSAFVSYYTILERLEQVIIELDDGGTQEACKRQLGAIKTCFSTLSKTYERDFYSFSKVCKSAENALSKSVEGICYAQDLRYLLCELCVEYVTLSNQFKL